MSFHRQKLVAFALASWHLLLGAAGYSLHVVLGERVQPCTQAASACGCAHDHGVPNHSIADNGIQFFSLDEITEGLHDPQSCALCRWLAQPRVSLWCTIQDAGGSPLVWLPFDSTTDPVSAKPRPYAARAPPSSGIQASV
jgi:hypothetical protein